MIPSQPFSKDAGSFRDPSGTVFIVGERILRSINKSAQAHYEAIRDQQVVLDLVRLGKLLAFKELERQAWPHGMDNLDVAYIVEHPKLPYISYPYEWSFSQLKDAVLQHLDIQLVLLENRIVLSDSTAYNVQFVGSKPVFIDLLSLTPYKEGQYWLGYRQFCEQFLNPLLLRALQGIHHNTWFRGSLEGISTSDIAPLIPFLKKFSWNILTHIVLFDKLQKKLIDSPNRLIKKAKTQIFLSKHAYQGILMQMKNWIGRLEPLHRHKTVWEDYANTNTYTSSEVESKKAFIKTFLQSISPKTLVDLGCNTGDYSILALESGVEYVVGFDFDQNAVEYAFFRAKKNNLPFLPLFQDVTNPSPNQGWMQTERKGFSERAKGDALIALAFEHHLAIAKNIPLKQIIEWLVSIAPHGVIEFVPKSDPTIQSMLSLREDIFLDYNIDSFEFYLKSCAKIVQKSVVSESGRCLFWYNRENKE